MLPREWLRNRSPKGSIVSLQTATSYVKQIAEALQYARDRNLVYRCFHRYVFAVSKMDKNREEVWNCVRSKKFLQGEDTFMDRTILIGIVVCIIVILGGIAAFIRYRYTRPNTRDVRLIVSATLVAVVMLIVGAYTLPQVTVSPSNDPRNSHLLLVLQLSKSLLIYLFLGII